MVLRFTNSDFFNWNGFFDYIMHINSVKCFFIEPIFGDDNTIQFMIRPNDCGHLDFEPDCLGKYNFEQDSISKIILDAQFKILLFLEAIHFQEYVALLN